MATLPRTYTPRQKNNNMPFPFGRNCMKHFVEIRRRDPSAQSTDNGNYEYNAYLGTSPKKLQEMTFPDGNADTTIASISMKQYEEQLNGLKKENFHLKLRIYFLEEKLGNGSPPAVQGLLEHNVRLQVELEELRRQLSDKQQLLAAAAQAIDVLEQQVSMSMDSDESATAANVLQRKVQHLEEQVLEDVKPSDTEALHGTDVTTDGLFTTDGIGSRPDQEELLKLKREHHKALQMIQSCMKRIQQQEKQIKKLKFETEAAHSQVSEPQAEDYKEILRCKNEYIQTLQQKLHEVQADVYCQQGNDQHAAGNLQELLARRLQGLAYFLDKLLLHKCVLGEDKKKLAESLLEQSLALPVGLKLDETMAPGDLTMDESALDISQSLRMEDLTMMFGHHVLREDCRKSVGRRAFEADLLQGSRVDRQSESECWSEPDRNVSSARMGIGDVALGPRESSCEERRRQGRRQRGSHQSSTSADVALQEELQRLRAHVAHLEELERKKTADLEAAERSIDTLKKFTEELREALTQRSATAETARQDAERAHTQLQLEESRRGELEAQAAAAVESVERLRAERRDLETTFAETERSLRRAADEAALQASQAALERTRAHRERLRLERVLEEARVRLAAADTPPQRVVSDDDRPTSPDQGIDSDRLSSLELTDAVAVSPRTLYEENVVLKQKLARTKATLADTLNQLNAANVRKMSVQRAICREIHKTHGVLRQARDQFESHN